MGDILTAMAANGFAAVAFLLTGLMIGQFVCHSEREDAGRRLLWCALCAYALYFGTSVFYWAVAAKKRMDIVYTRTVTLKMVPAGISILLHICLLALLCMFAVRLLKQRAADKRWLAAVWVLSLAAFAAALWLGEGNAAKFVCGWTFYPAGMLPYLGFFSTGLYVSAKRAVLPAQRLWTLPTDGRRALLFYFLAYTATFIVLLAAVMYVNLSQHKLLVWKVDAMPQYFTYLHYVKEYLLDWFSGILHGDFTLRMYDFTIGMGDDVRAILSIHPFELFCVFVPDKYLELFYNFLMVFRYYLAGLTFSAFCMYRGKSKKSTLVASVVYVFCGFTLRLAVEHPVFGWPLISLPLLLLALDLLIRKKGRLFFSLVVAIMMTANFYFLYMSTVAMGVYALIRFFRIYRENRWREFAGMMGRIIAYYLLGCAMAAVFVAPVLVRVLTSSRVGLSGMSGNILFYDWERVLQLVVSFISSFYSPAYHTYLSLSVVALPAVAVLFTKRGQEYFGLKLALVLEAAGLCIPAVGFVMSGFGTVNNRWAYILAFTAAYAVAEVMEDFLRLTKAQVGALLALLAVYGGCTWCFIYAQIHEDYNDDILVSFCMLALTTAVILLLNYVKRVSRNQLFCVMLTCAGVSVALHGCWIFSHGDGGMSSEYMEYGEVSKKILRSTTYGLLKNIEDEEFFRVDSHLVRDCYENMGLAQGYNATSMYNSVINSDLLRYHVDMENIGISAVHRLFSMDGRQEMEALANVRYYMAKAGEEQYVPYGYSKVEELSNDKYWIYKNDLPLAFGYSYDTYLSRTQYEEMDALQKQSALMDSVLLEEIPENVSLPNADTEDVGADFLRLPAKIKRVDEGLSIEGTTIRASEEDLGFTLEYERKEGYTAYLRFHGLDWGKRIARVYVDDGMIRKNATLRGLTQTYSLGRTDYLVNLGYGKENAQDELYIMFNTKGKYTLESMEFIYVPIGGYEEAIDARNEDAVTDVVFGRNKITAKAQADKDRLVVFSIPYTRGWTAYVDGEKTELLQANATYTGLALTAGEHEIELVYETPGFKAGLVITCGALAVFILLVIVHAKKKTAKAVKEEKTNAA